MPYITDAMREYRKTYIVKAKDALPDPKFNKLGDFDNEADRDRSINAIANALGINAKCISLGNIGPYDDPDDGFVLNIDYTSNKNESTPEQIFLSQEEVDAMIKKLKMLFPKATFEDDYDLILGSFDYLRHASGSSSSSDLANMKAMLNDLNAKIDALKALADRYASVRVAIGQSSGLDPDGDEWYNGLNDRNMPVKVTEQFGEAYADLADLCSNILNFADKNGDEVNRNTSSRQ